MKRLIDMKLKFALMAFIAFDNEFSRTLEKDVSAQYEQETRVWFDKTWEDLQDVITEYALTYEEVIEAVELYQEEIIEEYGEYSTSLEENLYQFDYEKQYDEDDYE